MGKPFALGLGIHSSKFGLKSPLVLSILVLLSPRFHTLSLRPLHSPLSVHCNIYWASSCSLSVLAPSQCLCPPRLALLHFTPSVGSCIPIQYKTAFYFSPVISIIDNQPSHFILFLLPSSILISFIL